MALEKTYKPAEVEAKHYARWENSGAFACGLSSEQGPKANSKPYTIVIPPPNVTGSLHMGHALNNTLQDILTRFHRMRGRDALWQPGMDHAGIATQMVVERQLAEDGLELDRGRRSSEEPTENRTLIGRDAFIDKVWEWKAESGGTITGQLRRLGASCDWSRERFTMDDGLSRAVRKVFVALHKEDLIYRDQRLVNWDPKFHTAISDLEVEQRETVGKLWYFKYPVEGLENKYITVATTRPETMLGDTGVAVHPEDERYSDLVGRNVVLPLVGRVIPIVADEYSDPEKGSGAVKITPGHDFNDFEVGRRHDLELINVFDMSANLTDDVPEQFRGLDRFKARDKVVAEMEALGLLDRIEDNPMTVPYGDRSGVVIEPRLTDQWYVDAKTMAAPAIQAVEQGTTRFVPRHWENTYYEWMRNIQPWCISRQIWWGHQIPAWYGPDDHVFVEESEEDALAAAEAHYGQVTALRRDEDVLDTWFSSALWPFSTLGWPDETPEVDRYYPTDVLVTGFDIIFFWVARMMMMGLHFKQEVPFHTVYIHALVRDEQGQKMSKSKGNVLDPLDLIDQYGADALRFTLTAMAAQGRDIKLSTGRIEGYRNFITKLWNAARYTEINDCVVVPGFDPAGCKLTVNKWIVSGLVEAERQITLAVDDYRFNDAANAVYQFTWHMYCDWYLEFTKPILMGGDEAAKAETRATTAWVMDQVLHVLHPFAPFVTEELWEQRAPDGGRAGPLITADWPVLSPGLESPDAAAEMGWLVRLITDIRAVRAEMNVPAKAKTQLLVQGASAETDERLARHGDLIRMLARVEEIATSGDAPKGSVQLVLDEATYFLPLGGVIDVGEENARLEKEVAKNDSEIIKLQKRLANEKFISRAPPEVVEENRERLTEFEQTRDKLKEALARLAAL
ncbi:MAG: valine--tRNA ligase [Rhodospirillaceae bacterium]|jgi:valyl-tRNA synthetase|nr:valine--tRNA ligase [Rhodospirillaceae bacterium]